MRRLSALVAGTAMAISLLAAPMASANRDTEVRYYPSGQTVRYYPANQTADCYTATGAQYMPARTVGVAEPGMAMVPGSRVFFVSDNPRYDLSGANETYFLVDDGSAYRTSSGRNTVTYVTAVGGYPQPVVAIPSEYRQDWLAVAAGDRPVRVLTSVGTASTDAEMAMVPASRVMYTNAPVGRVYTSNMYPRNGYKVTTTTTYTNGSKYRARKARSSSYTSVKRTRATNASTRSYTVRKRPRATTAAYTTKKVTRTYEPMASGDCYTPTATTASFAAAAPIATNDLYQIGNTWYMETSDGNWARSNSWRGPFVRVKKGHVPREVLESNDRNPLED